jgi:hypothetical protein
MSAGEKLDVEQFALFPIISFADVGVSVSIVQNPADWMRRSWTISITPFAQMFVHFFVNFDHLFYKKIKVIKKLNLI